MNKIESAVRLKHISTGIVINSRSERDQHTNRKFALKALKAKLYELEVNKRKTEQDKLISAQSENSFGSQIRTTTISPQALVKDHRSKHETTNVQSYLDGNLKEFMTAMLT